MTPESVMSLGGEAMQITLMVAAPILLTVLIIGLVVSIFQAATSINEATIQFVPKLAVMLIVLVFAGPWMLQTLMDFITRLYNNIPQFIG